MSLEKIIRAAVDRETRPQRTKKKRKGRRCVYCHKVSPDAEMVTHFRGYVDSANVEHKHWTRTTSYHQSCHDRQQYADRVSDACHEVIRAHKDLGLPAKDRKFIRRWLRRCETLEAVAIVMETVQSAAGVRVDWSPTEEPTQ